MMLCNGRSLGGNQPVENEIKAYCIQEKRVFQVTV